MFYLLKEIDQQRIAAVVDSLIKQYNQLKVEFHSSQEQKIIDTMVGKVPVYDYLQSLRLKKKESGELLFGEKDWPALFAAIKESLPLKEKLPITKTKVKNQELSDCNSEEKIIELLEQLLDILCQLLDLYHEIMNMLIQVCEQIIDEP